MIKKKSKGEVSIRDKYKPMKLAVLKEKADEENKSLSSGGGSDFLTIDEGTNKFRIFPPHEGEDSFYITRVVWWLTIENEDGEAKRRTVKNSRIHGGTKYDIVEEYLKGAKLHLQNIANSDDDEADEANEKIKTLSDWKQGLVAQTTWVMYANKITKDGKEFGKLEVRKPVRDDMNRISSTEDIDEPIEVDPFTDPDEGLPLFIEYTAKSKKSKAKTIASLGRKPKAMPLSDEDLEMFDKITPLTKAFRDNYTMDDFDLALEGLKNYDEEHEIDFFESEEFEEIIEKVKAQYDEEDEKKSSKKKKKGSASKSKHKSRKPVEEEEDEEDDDDDEEEDEPPVKKGRGKAKSKPEPDEDEDDDDEEDEDDEPPVKKGKVMKGKKRPEPEDEDDDDEDEDEDESPVKKGKKRPEPDDEDEDDEDEDDDEEEAPKKKKGNAPTLEEIKATIRKNRKK